MTFSFSENIGGTPGGGSGETPGNGKITINQGGVKKGDFTVNQSNDDAINLDAAPVNLWTSSFVSYYEGSTLETNLDSSPKTYTVDLSTLLPDDGAQYEVLFLVAASSGNLVISTDIVGGLGGYIGTSDQRDQLLAPVGIGRSVLLTVYSTVSALYFSSSCYRKIG